jgi:anti-sigma regulatory factor (Ser/Thr protein kinase)
MLLSSDGIVEAHDRNGDMFGFGRVREVIARVSDGDVIGCLLEGFGEFTGPGHEPEDDVTLVSIRRAAGAAESAAVFANLAITVHDDFAMPSAEGNERAVMSRVADIVGRLGIAGARLERLKTAVAEAAMNAIEHGNHSNPELPVEVQVTSTPRSVTVRIADQGGADALPAVEPPDIAAKLAGEQKPRGWGLFLIEKMVDEMHTSGDGARHVVELVMHREEEK